MLKTFFKAIIVMAVAFSLTACGNMGNFGGSRTSSNQTANTCSDGGSGTKTLIGSIAGAILGGFGGSKIGGGSGQLWATGGGAILGALIGGNIGRSLDRADCAYLEQQAGYAMTHTPVGQTYQPAPHYSESMGQTLTPRYTPRNSWETRSGLCREVSTEIFVGGKRETGTLRGRYDEGTGTWDLSPNNGCYARS